MERKSHSAAVKENGSQKQSLPTQPTPEQVVAAMGRTVERVREMTRQEVVQSLKDAGILTRSGKLSAKYG